MTLAELRKILNELPVSDANSQIRIVDLDTIDVFDISGVSYDTSLGHVWINVTVSDD